MDWGFVIYKFVLAVVIMLISLVVAMYSTYIERKVAGFFQDRYGPDRAGPFGIFQPLADGLKLLFKEEFVPHSADHALYVLGPMLTMLVALLTSAVIPFGNTILINGNEYSLQVADVNIGVLYIFAVISIGVYGIMIGGWASNNKYSLMGAVRASSQMISYELAMGMAILAVVMMTGTMSLKEIVEQQHGMNWNIWYQPLGFIIFLVCAFAETNRAPFDLPECETELIGGYHTEYSSMKLGFYLFAEYINVFISAAVISTLYFGGYNFPGMDSPLLSHNTATLIGSLVFFVKITLFGFFFMWIRWTLPRFRYDQLMQLGWKKLLPLAIINMIITGIVIYFTNK
jgi:NADH-quinone oxidoreductase subunit H